MKNDRPLPLADLLDELQSRGMSIGVGEYLAVGRLLEHWEDPRIDALKAAVAALLARNQDDRALICKAFEDLYKHGKAAGPATTPQEAAQRSRMPVPLPNRLEPPPPPPPLRERLAQAWRGFLRHVRARWLAWTGGALLAAGVVLLAMYSPKPTVGVPVPTEPIASTGSAEETPPPPPVITNRRQVRDLERSLRAAAVLSLALLLWLYLVRAGGVAQREGRRNWRKSVDGLPGPASYNLPAGALQPPFPVTDLDDVATILTQRFGSVGRLELDVDRTIDRTVRGGLVTEIVMRPRRASVPVLVLEDTGDEMRPWRRRVDAFLSGLETRGVRLDRWRFHTDAGRVFCSISERETTLRDLALLQPDSPLLIVSTGQGLLEGEERRFAGWVQDLGGWHRSVWLHPGSDPTIWRPALSRLPFPVHPMSREGLRAAARQLVLDGSPDKIVVSGRPLVPLDVERLRYLLSLSPRHDPEFAELLRQHFCPWVPEDAVAEALALPPLDRPLTVGPLADEVHSLLAKKLGESRAPQGSAAGYRLRLDHAMQEIRLPERRPNALQELEALAQGPLAAEVESAVDRLLSGDPEAGPPLPPETLNRLAEIQRDIRSRAGREGSGRSWVWPRWGELAAGLLCGLGFLGLAPLLGSAFQRDITVEIQENAYVLQKDEDDKGSISLLVSLAKGKEAPGIGDIRQYKEPDEQSFRQFALPANGPAAIPLEDRDRGYWYYARAELPSGGFAISNAVWVKPRSTTPPLEETPSPPEETPGLEETPTPPEETPGPEETPAPPEETPGPEETPAPPEETPTPPPSRLQIRSVTPNTVQQGKATLTLEGEGLDQAEGVSFSPSSIAADFSPPGIGYDLLQGGSPNERRVEIDASKAEPGLYSMTVTGPNGAHNFAKALTVAEPPRPAPLPPFKNALREVLSKFQDRKDFYFESKIPSGKLSTARFNTGVPTYERVIALVDATVWGGAARAFLFGERGVYYRSNWGTHDLTYLELTDEEITRQESDKIAIGKHRFGLVGSDMEADELFEILQAVQALARQYREAGALK